MSDLLMVFKLRTSRTEAESNRFSDMRVSRTSGTPLRYSLCAVVSVKHDTGEI